MTVEGRIVNDHHRDTGQGGTVSRGSACGLGERPGHKHPDLWLLGEMRGGKCLPLLEPRAGGDGTGPRRSSASRPPRRRAADPGPLL